MSRRRKEQEQEEMILPAVIPSSHKSSRKAE
jgi:hypothetical protein